MVAKDSNIVVVGGGFGGLFTALALAGSASVTLISDLDHYLHTPLLYEYLSGEVEAWHIAPRYAELLDENVSFEQAGLCGIDFTTRQVDVGTRKHHYDTLVLALGGVTNYWGVPGAEEFALPFRKLRHAEALRARMQRALDQIPPGTDPQDVTRRLTFVVVGGGASGVELATKMADLLHEAVRRRALKGPPRIIIVEMGGQLLPGMGDELREYVAPLLKDFGIEVHLNTRVTSVSAHDVALDHNGQAELIEVALTVWVAGVKSNPLLDQLDLVRNERGQLLVRDTLQVRDHDNVFALGDIAFLEAVPAQLAGTAQLAFQQSSCVAANVKLTLAGAAPKAGHFKELGEALSLGVDNAATLVSGNTFSGALARKARFALYTTRLPTWHHRLRVGASWFFEGNQPRPMLPLGIDRND